MRVRSLNMNDAHIYCTPEQFAAEFNAVNEMYLKYFKIFGIEKYEMRFSTSAPEGMGKKYVDEPELWKQTEDMVREVLKSSGINFVEVPNEAAFYGPKIDVQVWSAIGREFTIATNQVDFAVPETLRPRLQGPRQHREDAAVHPPRAARHARTVHRFPHRALRRQLPALARARTGPRPHHRRRCRRCGLRQGHRERTPRATWSACEGDYGTDKINGKVQNAEKAKVHTMLVIGPRDVQAGAVSVRLHGKGNVGAKPKAEVVADILQAIKERRA